jgi:phospholipase C
MALENIEHVVVVMMENRSFDNLLGWLYDNLTDPPRFNIPDQVSPTFEGLRAMTHSNQLNGATVFACRPPTAWPPAV